MKRIQLLVMGLALLFMGCGGSGASTPESAAKALVGAMSGGDGKAAMSVLPTDDAFKEAFDCPAEARLMKRLTSRRARLEKEASNLAEKKVSLSIKSFTAEPMDTTVIKKGEEYKGCKAKVDVTIQKHKLTLLIKKDGKEKDDGEKWKFARFGDKKTWYYWKL